MGISIQIIPSPRWSLSQSPNPCPRSSSTSSTSPRPSSSSISSTSPLPIPRQNSQVILCPGPWPRQGPQMIQPEIPPAKAPRIKELGGIPILITDPGGSTRILGVSGATPLFRGFVRNTITKCSASRGLTCT